MYIVTFQYSETTYCTNIAIGTIEAVSAHYSKYPWFNIRTATNHEIETAKRKGMPFITC